MGAETELNLYLQHCDKLEFHDKGILILNAAQEFVSEGLCHATEQVSQWLSSKGWKRALLYYPGCKSEFSHLLPGISLSGRSLISTGAGYLCPVTNVDGLIVGLQIRLRVLGDNDKSRYRWLTSKTKNRPNGQTPHLYPEGYQSEELPLSIHIPQQLTKLQIGICEGVGAKPFLASQRLGIPVIGAAGGQHASSPHIFKHSIIKLQKVILDALQAQEFQNKEIELVIFPDAGSVTNKNVMNRLASTVSLLKEWNLNVKFAWWGQWEKKDKDIDELDDLSNIYYISPNELFALEQTKKFNNQKRQTPKDEPKTKERSVIELPQGEEWEFWRQVRNFTADIVFEKKHFEYEIPELGTFLAVLSGL